MEGILGYISVVLTIPLASMFVLVPKRVQQPPNIDAYETGISIFEEETPNFRDKEKTTGNNTTTTGVLLMKPETKATSKSSKSINLLKPREQNFPKKLDICSIILHLFSAALITNIAAIVRGASEENIESISSCEGHAGKWFVEEIKKTTANNISAVTSTGTFSKKNEIKAHPNSTKLIIASNSIVLLYYAYYTFSGNRTQSKRHYHNI